MSDLMIDLETLSVTPDATILTIGAQGFNPFTGDYTDVSYYKRLTLESQADRHVLDSTVEWWGKQNAAAQEEALGDGPDRVSIKEALEELSPIAFKHERIWANGITFDISILEHAFRANGMSLPWNFWQVYDARTIYKSAKMGSAGASNTHNALEDCLNQIDMLQKALEKLGVTSL